MKKKYTAALLFCFVSLSVFSQVRLKLYGNYAFDDGVDSYYSNTDYYNGTIKGGLLWGGGIQYRLNPNYGVELLYLRQDTDAPVEYYDVFIKHTKVDLGINHIMLAGERAIPLANEKIEPYGGLMAGMSIISMKNTTNGDTGNTTKFVWGARLGTNIWVTDVVAINLQAQLLSIPQAAGGGVYFGSGGVGSSVSTYSSIYQFSLGGGLVFKLAEKSKTTNTGY